MRLDAVVVGGSVVTESGVVPATVAIAGGRIEALIDPSIRTDAAEVIPAHGRFVLPGAVDTHVHFNEPGRTEWEGFATGTASAAAGGVTTVVEMPLNANPPTINAAAFDLKTRAIEGKAFVDYALWGGLVADNLASLEEMRRAGVVGYKAFMIDTGTEFTRVDDRVLWAGMREIAASNGLLGVHAENQEIAARLQTDLMRQGRKDLQAWSDARPPIVELEAVQRALFLARQAACRLHLVHLSLDESVSLVAAARSTGQPVTLETCPHYLLLDDDMFVRLGPVAKCTPPLRSRAAVEALWKRVLDGTIDCLASDHSPCPIEAKLRGRDNVWDAWGGINGVQTLLPLMISEGVHRRNLSVERLVALTATNPAKIFGLYPKKGILRPGADADIAIVDLDREWTITPHHLHYRHRHTPFLGWIVKGWVERVLVRGRTIALDGEIVGPPGYGRLLCLV